MVDRDEAPWSTRTARARRRECADVVVHHSIAEARDVRELLAESVIDHAGLAQRTQVRGGIRRCVGRAQTSQLEAERHELGHVVEELAEPPP